MNYILNFPLSALLYVSVIILITFLAYLSTKANDKFKILTVTMIILILTFFSGLRGETVGTDTEQYLLHIERWFNNLSNTFDNEPGLYIISKISFLIVNDPQSAFVIVAFVINTLIILRTWSLRSEVSFAGAMFLYTATYYIMTFSGLRQWLAVSIIYFASTYILQQKYLKFSLFTLLACFFHNSAVLAFILPLLDSFVNHFKERKQKFIITFSLILSPIIFLLLFIIIKQMGLISQYQFALDGIDWKGSSGLIIWVKIAFALLLYYSVKKKELSDPISFKKVFFIYLFGLLISIPGYYISNLVRIGWYFLPYQIVFFGMIIKARNNKKQTYLTFLFIMFTIITFLIEINGSGRGEMPYYLFWDD